MARRLLPLLCAWAAHQAFLAYYPRRSLTRRRAEDARWRPAGLLYQEEEPLEDDEIDDSFDEITIDTMESLDESDPEPEIDIAPKFKRKGYFQRQDLSRLNVSDFDRRGELRRLSVEQLERRLEKRYASNKAQPRTEIKKDEDEDEDYDVFWKPVKHLRPAKSRRAARPAPEPVPEVVPEPVKGKGRARSLDSWLLSNQGRRKPRPEPEKRVVKSVYGKMHKAVMRNYGPLPWDRVEGQTSWLDRANQTWQELGLESKESGTLQELMKSFGVSTPNRLQGLALPEIMSGKDVMLTSTTGSGKTLAFLLPLLERYVLPLAKTGPMRRKHRLPHHLAPKVLSKPKILIVSPGRELSRQTAGVVYDLLAPFSPWLNVTNLVGKDNHKRQDENLRDRQPVVVVGTPGKLMDHAMEGRLMLNELGAIVIDEVDSLLSMSRKDHVELLLQHLGVNDQAQRVLVSASGSMEGDALGFAEAILRDDWKLVGPRHGMELPKRVLHLVNGAPDVTKKLAFLRRLATSSPECNMMLVFCNNHERVRKVAEQMNERGIPTEFLTGNRTKEARDLAVKNFARHNVQALVATDAAMRGLDFKDLTHVVNFELPGSAATYAHRAGRCGRMGFNGITISLASGGFQNNRLRQYARELAFELIEANVNDGVLGADLGMMYSPDKKRKD